MTRTDGFPVRIYGDFYSDLTDTQHSRANGAGLPTQYRHFLRGDGHQQGKRDSNERSEPNHSAPLSPPIRREKGQRVAGVGKEKAQTVMSGLRRIR
jgi:hypothetical protein